MIETLANAQGSDGWLYAITIFIGLMVGSFLNVVIVRVPQRLQWQWQGQAKGITKPTGIEGSASHCPHCRQSIRWRDNLPLISFLVLKGRCHWCSGQISRRYPLIEALCAALTLIVVWVLGFGWLTLATLAFTWCMIALAAIDIEHFLLPDCITLPLLGAGLIVNAVGGFADLTSAIVGAVAGYGILWAVFQAFRIATGKEGMGYGDFKLLAALGAWMGWQMLPLILLLSAGTGAIIGITMLVLKQQERNQPVPFGPYLAGGGWLALLWGMDLNQFYLAIAGL